MKKKHNVAVLGVVPNRIVADRVIADLLRTGFMMGDLSVLLPNNGGGRELALEPGTKAPEGAVAGGTAGGALGGALGLLVSLGAIAIPGMGPFIAAGPIMAALSGAAVGAAMGSLTGALIGLGVPEIEARAYEGRVKRGAALVAVHTESLRQITAAQRVFRSHGAEDVSSRGEAKVPPREPSIRDAHHRT